MNISFSPLLNSHFPQLLSWLEEPHVKAWWDKSINWTPELIEQRYGMYVKGYKVLRLKDKTEIKKPLHALIINYEDAPIGYIQYYNKHDFPFHHGHDSKELPKSCAGLDWYIGKTEYIGRGIGSAALNQFLEEHIFKEYNYAFVDPEFENTSAIKAYDKCGFKTIRAFSEERVLWMLKERNSQQNKFSSTLNQLIIREPIFHHPDQFGNTRQAILDMTCEDFWEIGASGNVYTREDVLDTLLRRYNDPYYEDIWETKDFKLIQIAPENYLITYMLIQGKRVTRRSTIWRNVQGQWKILYHQETLVKEGTL